MGDVFRVTGEIDDQADGPSAGRRRTLWASLAFLGLLAVGGTWVSCRGTEARAQSLRAAKAPAFVYKQTVVYYTRMAETLNEWAAMGWEPYQIVPIASGNPGGGGAMQVAIVFRHTSPPPK